MDIQRSLGLILALALSASPSFGEVARSTVAASGKPAPEIERAELGGVRGTLSRIARGAAAALGGKGAEYFDGEGERDGGSFLTPAPPSPAKRGRNASRERNATAAAPGRDAAKTATVGLSAESLRNLKEISEGAPGYRERVLPKRQYVKVKARRLKGARVLWINRRYLREHGVDVPDGPMTPEVEAALLDAFAYGVPGMGEPESAFGRRRKVMFADRYGGSGTGTNVGSGRAASAGKIQVKGIGRTPLAVETRDHANGLVSLEEGMREVFWAEVNQELPYGANQVIALIDRGTRTETPDRGKQPNVLVVREDPIRPAHFMPLYDKRQYEMASLDPRTYADRLARALPVPGAARKAPLEERIAEGFLTYVDRTARQNAAAFVRKFYHGATSESNIELSGRYLDYGTETALPAHGKLKVLDFADPAGSTREFKKLLVLEVARGIRERLPAEVRSAFPANKTLLERFDESYRDERRREFVYLTGVPAPVAPAIERSPQARALAATLDKVATDGARTVIGKYQVSEDITRYDLKEVLDGLAALRSIEPAAIADFLARGPMRGAPRRLGDALAAQYAAYMRLAEEEAARHGIKAPEFWTQVAASAEARNRDVTTAYRWKMMEEDFKVSEAYMRRPDPAMIEKAIDERIAASAEGERGVPYLNLN